jgi:hypothetical protein
MRLVATYKEVGSSQGVNNTTLQPQNNLAAGRLLLLWALVKS